MNAVTHGAAPTRHKGLNQCFSTFLLQRNLAQMFALFTEPCAKIYVSILLQTHRAVVVNFAPGKFGPFRRNPWQPLADPQLENIVLTFSNIGQCENNQRWSKNATYAHSRGQLRGVGWLACLGPLTSATLKWPTTNWTYIMIDVPQSILSSMRSGQYIM